SKPGSSAASSPAEHPDSPGAESLPALKKKYIALSAKHQGTLRAHKRAEEQWRTQLAALREKTGGIDTQQSPAPTMDPTEVDNLRATWEKERVALLQRIQVLESEVETRSADQTTPPSAQEIQTFKKQITELKKKNISLQAKLKGIQRERQGQGRPSLDGSTTLSVASSVESPLVSPTVSPRLRGRSFARLSGRPVSPVASPLPSLPAVLHSEPPPVAAPTPNPVSLSSPEVVQSPASPRVSQSDSPPVSTKNPISPALSPAAAPEVTTIPMFPADNHTPSILISTGDSVDSDPSPPTSPTGKVGATADANPQAQVSGPAELIYNCGVCQNNQIFVL
ncbi:hypothetical protein IWQ62_006208, partial [Dispira parvispora]